MCFSPEIVFLSFFFFSLSLSLVVNLCGRVPSFEENIERYDSDKRLLIII